MPRPKGSRNKPKISELSSIPYTEAARLKVEGDPVSPRIQRVIDGWPPAPPIDISGVDGAEALAMARRVHDGLTGQGLNGTLPRSERNCANCDASRLVGRELRCWVEPPIPQVAGWLPPLDEGGVGRPIVLALQRPTFPEYVCPRWVVMQADHPDFGAVTEAEASPAPVESRH